MNVTYFVSREIKQGSYIKIKLFSQIVLLDSEKKPGHRFVKGNKRNAYDD